MNKNNTLISRLVISNFWRLLLKNSGVGVVWPDTRDLWYSSNSLNIIFPEYQVTRTPGTIIIIKIINVTGECIGLETKYCQNHYFENYID